MGIQWLSLLVMFAIINKVFSAITLAAENELPKFNEHSEYPLSGAIISLKLAVFSNLRVNSKRTNADNEDIWISHMKTGVITLNEMKKIVIIKWNVDEYDNEDVLELISTNSNEKDRGFELTEVVSYCGIIVSFDEATGLVYLLETHKFYSWFVVNADSSESCQAMPIKWALVKDLMVYVGTNGVDNSNHVAVFDKEGNVNYENWDEVYTNINKSRKDQDGSTLVHEAVSYGINNNLYYFLPRYKRSSDNSLKPQNVMFTVSKDLKQFEEKFTISEKHEDRSFTSLKVMPGTCDSVLVAIQTGEKSEESYITAFDNNGIVILTSTLISSTVRYNSIEFM